MDKQKLIVVTPAIHQRIKKLAANLGITIQAATESLLLSGFKALKKGEPTVR